MTQEVLDRVKLYVYETGKAEKISANNCRINGHKELALRHENVAALSDQILKDLSA